MSQFDNGLRYNLVIQKINLSGIEVSVLRLDLIHHQISGNKWFKLKYNLEEAKKQGLNTILTFGGAFSNHIHATAAACQLAGIKSIGIIRGEKESESNPTLSEVKKLGMQLHFVSREEYRLKESPVFIEGLKNKFGNFYLIPEGGNNELGEKGCGEILPEENEFDIIFCASGTGTTFKGISNSLQPKQELIGINVLKFNTDYLTNSPTQNSRIENDYHFGGYAKHTDELLVFKKKFETGNKIPLDYVYTAKLFFAVNDMIKKNQIPPDSKILVIHSGGLQGNEGYEKRYFLMPNRKVKDAQG